MGVEHPGCPRIFEPSFGVKVDDLGVGMYSGKKDQQPHTEHVWSFPACPHLGNCRLTRSARLLEASEDLEL